jgi:predicted nucleic acid-binding protein
MKNKAYNVSQYAFSAGELVLPDANVWLYLYSPASIGLDARIVDAYTNAWDALLDKDAVACIDPIVISEVINRLLDEEWLRLDPPNSVTKARRYRKRKDFRQSADYPAAARVVEALAKQIMADSKPLDAPFSSMDIDVMLTDFGSGSTDWNDQLIVESCRHHGCKLLTNDADHTEGGIEVLTTHPRLLRACPS